MLYQMMLSVKDLLSVKEEKGQGLVEYALIIVLVSIAVIIILGLLGTEIGTVFSQIVSALGG